MTSCGCRVPVVWLSCLHEESNHLCRPFFLFPSFRSFRKCILVASKHGQSGCTEIGVRRKSEVLDWPSSAGQPYGGPGREAGTWTRWLDTSLGPWQGLKVAAIGVPAELLLGLLEAVSERGTGPLPGLLAGPELLVVPNLPFDLVASTRAPLSRPQQNPTLLSWSRVSLRWAWGTASPLLLTGNAQWRTAWSYLCQPALR